jgi:hypothetical protein
MRFSGFIASRSSVIRSLLSDCTTSNFSAARITAVVSPCPSRSILRSVFHSSRCDLSSLAVPSLVHRRLLLPRRSRPPSQREEPPESGPAAGRNSYADGWMMLSAAAPHHVCSPAASRPLPPLAMSSESTSESAAAAAPLTNEIWRELRVKAQPDSWSDKQNDTAQGAEMVCCDTVMHDQQCLSLVLAGCLPTRFITRTTTSNSSTTPRPPPSV